MLRCLVILVNTKICEDIVELLTFAVTHGFAKLALVDGNHGRIIRITEKWNLL